MKKAKYIALAVIIIMLSALFLSCAGEETTDNTTTTTTNTNTGDTPVSEEETVPEVEEEVYKIPEADFEGYTMRIVAISDEAWAITDMNVEEESGEPVNDAIYRRNRQVENVLNVVIEETHGVWSSHDMLKKAVAANSDEYDLMFAHASSGGPIASQGYYLNLHDISTLNLEESYWDQGAIKSFELMNKLYFTTSDSNLMTNDAIWVLYFNKKIIQDMALTDPYQLVRDGKWTADALYNLAREAAVDIDGDGAYTAADQWGIATHSLAFLEFLECFGEQLVRQDNNGYPLLIEPDDRFATAYSKARSLMNKDTGVYLGAGALPGDDFAHATTPFMNNRSLFCAEVLGWARTFREMTADFGILPHPKLDENQPTYLNVTANTVPIMAIPITNPNPERTGLFMDAMTALSVTTVTPAYYTISLEGKFARDEESIEMLDIIRSNRVYDLAVIYNWSNFFSNLITHGMSATGENPMTIFDKNRNRVGNDIGKTTTAFEAVN